MSPGGKTPLSPSQDEYARATRLSRVNVGSCEGEGRQGHGKASSMSGLSLGLAGPLSPLAASRTAMLLGRGPHRCAAARQHGARQDGPHTGQRKLLQQALSDSDLHVLRDNVTSYRLRICHFGSGRLCFPTRHTECGASKLLVPEAVQSASGRTGVIPDHHANGDVTTGASPQLRDLAP
jgi:hypothetical protein